MRVAVTKLTDVKLLDPNVQEDPRGYFMESYSLLTFSAVGIKCVFVQDNISLSEQAGVLRGLHYQLNPKAQSKLVRVTSGAIYDVVVDLRQGSPTFGHWEGFILSFSNKRQLFVPQGFAHGFCTLVPQTEVTYKVNEFYSPENDRGIAWNDPALGIDWPLRNPILSAKDSQHPILADAEINFKYEG
ncbi:dTDP-4-dehydrorhamnose 3,5-epimerase [Cohnella lupini]|uniref:dTDP-4-dehydrorhamnose 3,5-epimerase n=1 Tax=Cohnella lupini TaxID=1294267 RepID=A0A3D9I8Z1_9BACL|nr:dTDP-4-dehydrorhamnose 3,5-epimerase [Cohnella lupini]RED57626.1 dTDP-4-dehydrorhamnose 3,5-epimerase [Cohnella lupini]